jgi:hypothetical protein
VSGANSPPMLGTNQLTSVLKAMIEKYKAILTAESYFSNQNQASSTPAYTEAEQEQICSSLKTVSHTVSISSSKHSKRANNLTYQSTTQHTSLLDALSAQHDVFESTYIPVISALLKSDEDPTDAIFFQFVNMAPSCQETTKEGQDALVNKFSDVIAQYES